MNKGDSIIVLNRLSILIHKDAGVVLHQRVIRMKEASDAETSYVYDASGNLTDMTAPDGTVTSYTYDGNGNLLSMETGGRIWSYKYDAAVLNISQIKEEKMDYILEIIISEKEMKKVELYEKMIDWGGDICSYDPRQFETKSKIIFEQVKFKKYYEDNLGRTLGKDMIILSLKSSLLFDLEYDANQNRKLMEKNKLAVFLESLFQLEEFYIFLTQEDEIVKESYGIGVKGEIIDKLTESLSWLNPKDILIYKRQEKEMI